jgi:hypothetical protein
MLCLNVKCASIIFTRRMLRYAPRFHEKKERKKSPPIFFF